MISKISAWESYCMIQNLIRNCSLAFFIISHTNCYNTNNWNVIKYRGVVYQGKIGYIVLIQYCRNIRCKYFRNTLMNFLHVTPMIGVYPPSAPYMAHLHGKLHHRVHSNIEEDVNVEAFIHYIRGCNVSVYRCHIYLITVRDSCLERSARLYVCGKH